MESHNEGMSTYEIITTLLLILTFVATTFFSIWALHFSRKSTEATTKAVGIAEQTRIDSKKLAEQSAKENDERFEIQKKHAEAQIKALEDQGNAMKAQVQLMKDQFDINNMPFLTVEKPFINNLKIKEVVTVTFEIKNLGNYPIKTITTRFGSGFNLTKEDMMKNIGNQKFTDAKAYISKENSKQIIASHVIPESDESFIRDKKPYIFFGEIKYENPVNRKNRILFFAISIMWFREPQSFDYVELLNDDLPEQR